jgi:hypothetical protein
VTTSTYRRTRHSVSLLHAHLVFVTKYRRPVFTNAMLQWRVQIDGTPSLLCEIKPVTEGGFGQTTAELNAARAVNLVPRIVAAEPGCRSVLDFPAAVGST